MSRSEDDDLPWPPIEGRRHDRAGLDERRNDRAALDAPETRVVRDREAYLGQHVHDIGRRIADDQVELFVGTDAIGACRAEFDRVKPRTIVLHDLGTSASLHLLTALAGAARSRVQRLTVRRQGHGVAVAVLQFVEVPLEDAGTHVRIYSTDADADRQTRQGLAHLLLSRSRLAVLMLGELTPHALVQALAPLREAAVQNLWQNIHMLLLPLGSASAQAAQAAQALSSAGIAVRVTPLATRSADAWAFISGAWNRLHDRAAALRTEIARAVPMREMPRSEAPTELMPMGGREPLMQPEPPAPEPARRPPQPWFDYARRCTTVKGIVGACVFDLRTQRALAHAGSVPPTPERLAIQGGLLIDAMADAARLLGLTATAPDAAISYGQQHLVLRPVPGHAGIVVHCVVHAAGNELTLARMQLERVPPPQL